MENGAAVVDDGANMQMLQQFERHLKRSRFFNYRDQVVVAVSTGVDSMVLLDLLQRLPHSLRPQIIVTHVNHELRRQSIEEESYLRDYCRSHHLPLVVKHWQLKDHPQTGIEAAARRFRYDFFAEVMKENDASILVTAHHENDLAETMLMKLTRGGQLSQLVGINDVRLFGNGKLVRPLLPFSKRQLKEYARQRQLKWYEDETNQELAVQRNRIRHEVIPLLEQENPQFLDHLKSYHQQLSALLNWQRAEVQRGLERVVDTQGQLQIKLLLEYPDLIQRLLVQRWLNDQGVYDLKTGLMDELLRLIANHRIPQQAILLPNGFTVQKTYGRVELKVPNKSSQKLQKIPSHVIELEQWYRVDDTRQLAVATSKHFFQDSAKLMPMWLAPDQLPLQLRKWQSHDYLRLKNGGHQRVKRILIDQKVTQGERDHQLVLVDAHGEVVWLLDRKWSWFARPEDYHQQWQLVVIGIKDKEENRHE